MGYTLSQLRTMAWDAVGELSTDSAFTSTQLTQWINVGLQKLSIESLYYEKTISSLSVSAGTRTVTLPSDFIVTRHVLYTPSGGATRELAPVSYGMIRWEVTTQGNPQIYTIAVGSLVLDPPPNATSSSLLSGFYIAREPSLSGDSDEPMLPDEFRPYLAHYAAYEMMMVDNQPNQAQNHLQQFLEGQRSLTARFWDERIRRNMSMFREGALNVSRARVDLQGDQAVGDGG